jgi:hypothetical protein
LTIPSYGFTINKFTVKPRLSKEIKEIKVGKTYVTPKDSLGDQAGVVIVAESTEGYSAKVFSVNAWYDHKYNQQGQIIDAPRVEIGNHIWDLDLETES